MDNSQDSNKPVAWILTETLTKRETTTRGYLWFSDPQNCMWTPLYTSPPASKPLTDDRLEEMWEADTTSADDCKSLYYFKVVARAIEAAHDIKE